MNAINLIIPHRYEPRIRYGRRLCPALFKYFDKAPREIYVKAEAK